MYQLKKKHEVDDGNLFAIVGERRYLVAKCSAIIEVREHSFNVPILGKGKMVDSRNAVLLITFEHKPEIRDALSIDSFQFTGTVMRTDNIVEDVTLNNCLLLDELDLTEAGKSTFEVKCSENMVKKLLEM